MGRSLARLGACFTSFHNNMGQVERCAAAYLRRGRAIWPPSLIPANGGLTRREQELFRVLLQTAGTTKDIIVSLLVTAVVYLVALGLPARASLVTATITGTVLGGSDQGSNGIGVFGPVGNLAGRPFTLVFTFDDTKGQQTVSGTPPNYSAIQGSGSSSPGTAVLTIGGTSVHYPLANDLANSYSSSAWRSVGAAQ